MKQIIDKANQFLYRLYLLFHPYAVEQHPQDFGWTLTSPTSFIKGRHRLYITRSNSWTAEIRYSDGETRYCNFGETLWREDLLYCQTLIPA